MKTYNKIFKLVLLIGLCITSFAACDDDDKADPIDDLFRLNFREPVPTGNAVEYTWYYIEGAISYKLELSRDGFQTIDQTVTTELNKHKFENLKYSTTYQLRGMAIAQNPENNSKWGIADETRTNSRVVPNVLTEVEKADLTSESVILRWDTEYTVTDIIVEGADEGSTFKKEIKLSTTDLSNGYLLVEGLNPKTNYRATIYNMDEPDEDIRNWNTVRFMTTAVMPAGAHALELEEDLAKYIKDDAGPRILFLPDGYEYTFTEGMVIKSDIAIYGEDHAKITTTSQWTVEGTVGKIHFEGIDFYSDRELASSPQTYLFNSNADFTLGTFSLVSCTLDNYYRAIFRVQGTAGKQSVQNTIIEDCIIKNGNIDYYVLHNAINSADANAFNKIVIKNSTFYNLDRGVIRSDKSTGAINISMESCTFASMIGGVESDYLMQLNSAPAIVNISKCIFTKSRAQVRMVRHSGGTVTVSDSYMTSDWTLHKDNQVELKSISGAETIDKLFVDWENFNLNFKYEPATVYGAGDPRWLP